MLAILLKILSVIGIVLLILLGIVLLLLLLILFFPITYKIYGNKKAEDLIAKIKINWLFGLLRFRFFYPNPGNAVLKLLWFTVYDSNAVSVKPEESVSEKKQEEAASEKKPKETNDEHTSSEEKPTQAESINVPQADGESVMGTSESPKEEKKNLKQLIFEKIDKIKYTSKKIYDKIKNILENITFYKELLQEEDTKALLGHAWRKLVKILKKIFPKKLKADVLFGADSPDTTGYVLAVYSMLMPHIRKPCYINFTPDFTRAVLEGEIDAKGHITIFCVLINVLSVVLDKRLRKLINKIKRHSAKQKKS